MDDKRLLESARIGEKLKIYAHDKRSLNVTPILVDFRRLLQIQQTKRNQTDHCYPVSVVPGISDNDLLHAVVGLYDVSLSEMTPDVIYSTVCDKWAKTMILVRDLKDVFLEFDEQRDKYKAGVISDKHKLEYNSVTVAEVQDKSSTNEKMEDKFRAADESPATFACCYSDTESDESEDSIDEEDYSVGINQFLAEVKLRREARLRHEGSFTVDQVGAESRIVAAATFSKKYVKTGEKIIHLTLISTRKRFRRLGIGKYIIQKLKDSSVVDQYEALVVHSDVSAVDFFSRYGFNDDVIVNSRWREIAEQFTHCTLMTYIPAYTGQVISGEATAFDLLTLEQDLKQWKQKSIEAYQAQVTIIERMKSEMIRLRAMVSSQQEIIATMTSKISYLKSQKADNAGLHKVEAGDGPATADQNIESEKTTPDQAGVKLWDNVDSELRRYMVLSESSPEVYDHGKDIAEFHRICEGFKQSLKKDPKIHLEHTVTSVSKALLNQNVVSRYAFKLQSLGQSTLVMKLYYCGAKEKPERLKDILKNGFSEQDFYSGYYGQGIYFSRYASTATHFSPPNQVLIAEVIIGKCQTVIQKDIERTTPDLNHDSILSPGRLLPSCGDGSIIQEYIIFDPSQALPLDLIEFSSSQYQLGNQQTD